MTFAIESVLNLKAEGIIFLGPFNPHSFQHPRGTSFSLSSNHQKDWTITSLGEEAIIGEIPLHK